MCAVVFTSWVLVPTEDGKCVAVVESGRNVRGGCPLSLSLDHLRVFFKHSVAAQRGGATHE